MDFGNTVPLRYNIVVQCSHTKKGTGTICASDPVRCLFSTTALDEKGQTKPLIFVDSKLFTIRRQSGCQPDNTMTLSL
jgi:hypothetical protein